jgi:hypothetical protein
MAITNLVRDYGVEPCIVRMLSTDNYSTISAPGYLDTQMEAFNRINGGAFQWAPTDVVLVNYAGGWAFFTISPDFEDLNPFFPSPGFTSFLGDTGTAGGATVSVLTGVSTLNSGSSVEFVGNGLSTLTLNVTDSNNSTIIGRSSGNSSITGLRNIGLGESVLTSLTLGNDNICIGNNSGTLIEDGSNNIAIGLDSLSSSVSDVGNIAIGLQSLKFSSGGSYNIGVGDVALHQLAVGSENVVVGFSGLTALTSGNYNTGFGSAVFHQLATGSYNLGLGYIAGENYQAAESSNIVLNSVGIASESNVLRIGQATGTGDRELASAYICGIDGVNVGSVATVVTESGDQLGTAVITGGAGIAITPGSNTITISSTGATFPWTTIAGTTQAAFANNGYVVGNASATVITLPATFSVGDTVAIKGFGAGGWTLTANTGQIIQIGQLASSTAGSVVSAANYDVIYISGLVANTTWSMDFSVTSGFNVI